MTHTTTHTGRVWSARVQPRGVLENCWCALELGIGKNGLSWASSLRLQIVRRKFQSARSMVVREREEAEQGTAGQERIVHNGK